MKKIGIMLLPIIAITAYACVQSVYPTCGPMELVSPDNPDVNCQAQNDSVLKEIIQVPTLALALQILCLNSTAHGTVMQKLILAQLP